MSEHSLPLPDGDVRDLAARAGWLSYMGGLTQDEIAREMGVSRQRAQRLVSRAISDGLIRVRLTHPLAACLTLESALTERFGLTRCRVAPGLGSGIDPALGVAPFAAAELERVLRDTRPRVIALGTGRALRAMVDAMDPIEAPQHRLVSLIGNIAPDGSASYFDVIMRIAEKVRARHYPMPVPVVSATAEENEAFRSLSPVRRVRELAEGADVTFVGVGQMGADAPLLADGFLSAPELAAMQAAGAAGEVGGWVFDSQGRYLDLDINARVGGVRVAATPACPVFAVAAGASKVTAIAAALKSRIISGLITDEATAKALLDR